MHEFILLWELSKDAEPVMYALYVALQVNRFAESVLLIVQYRYLKSFSSPQTGTGTTKKKLELEQPKKKSPSKKIYQRIWKIQTEKIR